MLLVSPPEINNKAIQRNMPMIFILGEEKLLQIKANKNNYL
jgi:hypothetical protein